MKMGYMGIDLEDEVLRVYPDFPRRQAPRVPEHYLPPLSAGLQSILEKHS